jgi:hypothetical protein
MSITMISTALAIELRKAGLAWQPQERDCFTIPDSEFDSVIFSLHQQPALIELVQGQPAITFHGSSEWALDHVMTSEVIWLPSETQLREKLAVLVDAAVPLELARNEQGYTCRAGHYSAIAPDAESAYAMVLLQVLREPR